METKTISSNTQNYTKMNIADKKHHKNGFIASATVFAASKIPKTVLLIALMGKFKVMSNLDKDEFMQVEKGVNKLLKEPDFAEKGVSIVKYSDKNAEKISKTIMQEVDKAAKFLPKHLKEFFANLKVQSLKLGINAYTAHEANKIFMPEKDLALATFHEMGHVSNSFSNLGKLLQKGRYMSLLSIPILLTALLKPKKDSDNKSKRFLDKTTDFIKYNAGKLVFLTILPRLAEEELASIKGNQLAKKVLSEPLAKKVAKANSFAYLTYLGSAIISSIAIAKAVKEKDAAQ